MKVRPRILMDCDPGIDDAFAILCALRFTDLAAITTVSGNVSIDNTTRNARYILELAGAEVPVHRGAAAPLEVPAMAADDIHGRSGLGDMSVPEAMISEHSLRAVDAILEYCESGDAIIVATGPLTNIAQALLKDPTLAERISHLYWMGGSTSEGNVTDRAEFNAWADPHAVDVTFRSMVPLTMYGLNLTHQVRMTTEHIEQLRAAGSSTSMIMADLLAYYSTHGTVSDIGQPVHDTCAVLGVTHPELFSIEKSNIVTHVADDDRRGMTEVQDHDTTSATTVRVAGTAHASSVVDLVVTAAIDPAGDDQP